MALILNGTTGVSGVDGTSATPALQGNDSNTGVSFGTDIVTINTGGQARVTTDASGNVGIGTVSPATTLQVTGDITQTWAASMDRFVGSKFSTTYELGLHFIESSRETRIVSKAADSTGLISFYTGVTPTEKMRIDSSGNLGLGVTPSAWNASYKPIEIGRVGNAIMGGVAGSSMEMMTNVFLNTGGSYRYANNGAATDYYQNAGAHIWYNAPSGTAGNAISFTQAMTLEANNNLLLGTTSSSFGQSGFIFSPNYNSTGSSGVAIQHINGSSSGSTYASFIYNGTQIGNIAQSGTTSVAYNTTSDYRLKENVAPMQNALATVAALKPCNYTWKSDGSAGQGFIAHELQAVVPDCVTGTKDAVDAEGKPQYQGVDTSFLVATLVSAIQELTARLEVLENK